MITDHIENRFRIGGRMQHYGATATAIMTGVSIAISAVGTGLSIYAQNQQAEQASAMADYNYKVQAMNAEINARAAKQQAAYQAQAAQNQYQTQQNNAAQLEAQARAVEAQGRERSQRMLQEMEERQALLRNRYAKSGVTSEGSPLAVMARSAVALQLAIQDGSYQSEMEARALDRRAGLERAGSEFSLFDKHVAEYEAKAAEAGFALDLSTAEADRLAGQSAAQGYRTAMYGTILSGAQDIASQSTYFLKPSTKTKAGGKFNPYAEIRPAIRV